MPSASSAPYVVVFWAVAMFSVVVPSCKGANSVKATVTFKPKPAPLACRLSRVAQGLSPKAVRQRRLDLSPAAGLSPYAACLSVLRLWPISNNGLWTVTP